MQRYSRSVLWCAFLVPACCCGLRAVANAGESAPQQPNLLVIVLDDFGWRDAGFMGSDFYETPWLDQLARQGMVFTDAYAGAANCAPARACLLSGQYSPRHEIYNVGTQRRGNPKFGRLMHVPGTDTLDPELMTWAAAMQRAGYRTATIGKWHLSDDPLSYGFDVNIGGNHRGSPPRGYFPPHPGAPGLQDAVDGEYLTDRLHDEAVEFIRANQARPWLLYLTHFAVHTPLQAKQALLDKYAAKQPGELHSSVVMAAMIESVDQGVGRLIETLAQLQLTEQTVIVFTSDNGGYGPATSMAPLKGYKGTYYEGGIRVPLFVNWPGVVAAGTSCDVPVTGVDLYPTLCEIAGARLPQGQPLDGVSLIPLLKQQDWRPRRALYWHFPAYLQSYSRVDQQRDPLFRSRPCSIIRDGDWKLHQYFDDDGIELYRLSEDIGESTDLAARYPAKSAELLSKLQRWQQSLNAPIPTTPNPRYDATAEANAMKRASP